MLQLRKVNAAFTAAGIQEQLVAGNGYYYFTGGDADKWYTSSVPVYRLNQLDLKGWFNAWSELSGKPNFFAQDNIESIQNNLK